jgi:hypothetical protein
MLLDLTVQPIEQLQCSTVRLLALASKARVGELEDALLDLVEVLDAEDKAPCANNDAKRTTSLDDACVAEEEADGEEEEVEGNECD